MKKHIKQESSITGASSRVPQNPNIGVNYDNCALKEIWFAGGCFWGVEAYLPVYMVLLKQLLAMQMEKLKQHLITNYSLQIMQKQCRLVMTLKRLAYKHCLNTCLI